MFFIHFLGNIKRGKYGWQTWKTQQFLNSLFLRKDLKLAIDKNGVVSNSGGPYKLS